MFLIWWKNFGNEEINGGVTKAVFKYFTIVKGRGLGLISIAPRNRGPTGNTKTNTERWTLLQYNSSVLIIFPWLVQPWPRP